MDRRPAVLLFTLIVVTIAVAAVGWSALAFQIDAAISLTRTGGREGILLGLLFWVGLGLLGGLRTQRLHGHGVLTFHLPFIVAATAIGGPTAGAIVAVAGTFEARELREAPWYGTVFNHAALALAAVLGGCAFVVAEGWLDGMFPAQPQASQLASLILGSLVITGVSSGLVAATIMLRDGLTTKEMLRVFDGGHRATAAAEVVLGWLFTVTWTTIGWWGAAVCALLVLVAWSSHDARELARREPLSGLLSRTGFEEPLRRAIQDRLLGRRSAILAIDLDRFKEVNDRLGHAAGDEVIRIVGERLRGAIRLTDAAVRHGGDEFGVLLTDLPDEETALRRAWAIHAALCEPIEVNARAVSIGASIGLYVIDPDGMGASAEQIHRAADALMYRAKRRGGGVRTATRAATPAG